MADLRSTLFVGNLSVFCTEQEIESLFSTYGVILEIRMAKSEDKSKHLSYGFVKFASVASAQLALHELNGAILCGRPLKIGKAFSRSNKKMLGLPPQEPEYNTASVHVTFISHQLFSLVNEESLRLLFSQFGPVVDAVICKSNIDHVQGRQSGYGFIHFPGTEQGIEASFRAAEVLTDVMIDEVNYKCKISHHLEKHLRDPLAPPQALSPPALPSLLSAPQSVLGDEMSLLDSVSSSLFSDNGSGQSGALGLRPAPPAKSFNAHSAQLQTFGGRSTLFPGAGNASHSMLSMAQQPRESENDLFSFERAHFHAQRVAQPVQAAQYTKASRGAYPRQYANQFAQQQQSGLSGQYRHGQAFGPSGAALQDFGGLGGAPQSQFHQKLAQYSYLSQSFAHNGAHPFASHAHKNHQMLQRERERESRALSGLYGGAFADSQSSPSLNSLWQSGGASFNALPPSAPADSLLFGVNADRFSALDSALRGSASDALPLSLSSLDLSDTSALGALGLSN